jgi:DNA polymerase elongation subunit (family B)
MKILHIDIETAPNKVYAWGLWNQNIGINQIVEPGYTLCWAARWEGQTKIHFKSIYHHGKDEMLQTIWELLNEADAVVHYNGTKFDIPTLNGEFVQLGWEPPDPYHQIDLLKVVRQRFKLPSNKLDYVCQVVGLAGKVNHKGMELWHECMEGKASAWKEMKAYNIQDVNILHDLYHHVLPWIKNHPNHALYMKTDRPVCPNCGSENVKLNGVEHTKTLTYQRFRCTDCLTPIRGRTNVLDKDKRGHILTGSKL